MRVEAEIYDLEVTQGAVSEHLACTYYRLV
jgi:hypothetical protein